MKRGQSKEGGTNPAHNLIFQFSHCKQIGFPCLKVSPQAQKPRGSEHLMPWESQLNMLHHAISSHVLQGHRTGTFCLPHGCTCTTGPQEGHLTKPLCKQCGTREPLCQQTHLLHDKLIQQSALICMAVATAELWGTATQLWGCAPFTPSAKLQLPRSHTLSLRRWR